MAINIVKALIFNDYIYDEIKKHTVLAELDQTNYLKQYAVTQVNDIKIGWLMLGAISLSTSSIVSEGQYGEEFVIDTEKTSEVYIAGRIEETKFKELMLMVNDF